MDANQEDIMPWQYKCGHCGEVYEKVQSEEDSREEFRRNFGDHADMEKSIVICDDCWKEWIPTVFN